MFYTAIFNSSLTEGPLIERKPQTTSFFPKIIGYERSSKIHTEEIENKQQIQKLPKINNHQKLPKNNLIAIITNDLH